MYWKIIAEEGTDKQMMFTGEEREKITEKGRKWLASYLSEKSEGAFSDAKCKRTLFSVIYEKYRAQMESDPQFFESVAEFTGARRTADEKAKFFNKVIRNIKAQGLKEDCLRRLNSK